MSPPKSYNHVLLLLFSTIFIISQFYTLCNSQFELPECNADDKQVLLRIKKHLANPPSLSSWNLKNACGGLARAWSYIHTDENGRVFHLSFDGNDDIFSIPPFMDRLPALTWVTISDLPHLAGPIPHYIGKLNLTMFVITNTNMSGPIPSFLGRLTNLDELVLSSNKFTGPIPTSFRHLNRLTSLDLSSNSLTGPIPSALARLTKLIYLDLHANNFSGPIPEFLGPRIVSLFSLDLNTNSFSGAIPASLGRSPQLTSLSVMNNRLSGSVPKSLAGGKIGSIKLANNKLTGDASYLIDKRTNSGVVEVDISNNLFKFDLTNVELAPYLYAFNMSHNMIYGRLPKLIYRIQDRLGKSVDITYNELCGPIPNGRRLKQVNPNVFAHNKCLCGGPLPACK